MNIAMLKVEDVREKALQSMRDFAAKEGFPLAYEERDLGDTIGFFGKAPDGREYAVGYPKIAAA